MARKQGKRTRITVIAVLIILLGVIGSVALVKAISSGKKDPYSQQTNASSTQNDSGNTSGGKDTNNQQSSNNSASNPSTGASKDANKDATPDPSTVATITIDPLAIVVSYVKGVGGFEYEVLRTPSGTRYVEFRASSLVGTKCTDDQGAFASILENPNADESAAVTKTTTIGSAKYGLSLASVACTGDTSKLDAYQKSFSDAFGLLKKVE